MSQSEQSPHAQDRPALVPRLLAGLVGLVCRAPRLVLALCSLSVAASLYLACTRLQYRTQRDDLISPRKEVQQRWKRYLAEFGQDDDMVVVFQGEDESAHPKMVAALEALASRISAQPNLFDRLFYKVDLRDLRNRALLFLPPEEIRRIRQDLTRMRPLLDQPLAWSMFSLRGMIGEAADRLSHIQPGQRLPEEDVALLEQLRAAAWSGRATLADPAHYRNPWSGLVKQPERASGLNPEAHPGDSPQDLLARPQYFMSDDGKLAFLLVRPACKSDGMLGPQESVKELRRLVEAVRQDADGIKIGVTGLPVLEHDEMVASQSDTSFASWLALAGVMLVYLVTFRTLRWPFLTVSTLLVGTGWALGWTTITVGHLNLLSAVFAIMLIGMGDYGMLWVTRYQQEHAAGLSARDALRATAIAIGPSTLTASMTTCLGFFAAMLADFLAVAELGWIAGCGVLFCALACFTVLPALVMVMDGRKENAGRRVIIPLAEKREALAAARPWLPGLLGRPRGVLACGAIVLAVFGFWASRVHYDHNLLNLQADSLDSVRWERTLIQHTAGASWHALSHTASREEAVELRKRFEKLPEVSRVVEVASLVPAGQEEKLPLLRDIHARLSQLPDRGKPIIPLPSSVPLLVSDLRNRAQQWREDRFLPADEDRAVVQSVVWEMLRLADALAVMAPALAKERLQLFERRMVADLSEDLHRLRDVSTPGPITLDDMPESLRQRYVSNGGRWLLRVFGRESLWEFDNLRHFTQAVSKVDPEATGKPYTTLEGLRAMKVGFQWAGFYALMGILVVLVLDFRSPGPVLLVLGPLVAGAVLALGVMGMSGCRLNPANMIALPLIVGLSVNYGVHVMHDYLGRPRNGSGYTLRRSTGVGILVIGLTMLLGFGTLMLSSHRGLAGLGLILSLGVAGSMLTALVLLPAGLKLWSERQLRQPHLESRSEAA
jgi:hopanoid biosynthesis associated RND transporter like protein HpnN